MMKLKEKIPFRRALFIIVLTTLVVSGTTAFGVLYYLNYKAQRLHDPRYTIQAVVQSQIDGPYLHNQYFMELLGLATDRPTNLYQVPSWEFRNRLLESPLIKDAQIKKIRPHTLYISYESRAPIAYLADASNIAIDKEGTLFPYKPLIPEEKLPKFYLGTEPTKEKVQLALQLLELFQKDWPSEITMVDVANANALSNGKRQVVLILEKEGIEHILRLYPDEYELQKEHYKRLRSALAQSDDKDSKVIDFRIPQLAYLLKKEQKQ